MIDAINQFADKWFAWEFAMLWQVAVLIAVIAGLDLVIKRWIWPQVRYALWLLILVKLILPPSLTSPASFTAEIPFLAEKIVKSSQAQPPMQVQQPVELPNISAPVVSMPADSSPMNVMPAASNTAAEPQPMQVAQPKVKLSWKAYSLIGWLCGVLVLAGWLIIKLTRLRREHLQSPQEILPERFNELLCDVAMRLNLKKPPQVILTKKVCCPAVFGVFRPVLLMPADKFKNLTREDVEHILLHELAHIKRGDLLIHSIYMILQIAYWFNPLLWLIRKQMQNLRELCCDATVAKILREKTAGYRETLLETARQLLAEPVEPGMGLLGLFENSNWLIDRLHWLEKKTWKNRPLRILTVFVLVCFMSTCVIPMAKAKSSEENFDVPKEIIGNWEGKATVPDSWFNMNDLPISLTIKKDGTASGKIGDAEFYDGVLSKDKIAHIGKQRLWGSEYVIEGKLKGAINAKDGITRKTTRIQFDYDEKEDRLEGGTFSSGWALGAKKTGQVIGRRMDLRRTNQEVQSQIDSKSESDYEIPKEFVGHWKGQAQIIVNWTKQKQLPIDIEIHPDGNVKGEVGDAQLVNGKLVKKSWIYTKVFQHENPYRIIGDLQGEIIKSENIQRDSIHISLRVEDGKIDGGLGTSGTKVGNKENMILSAMDVSLIKIDENNTKITNDSKTNNFSAALPNGVKVELLGVCEHPSAGKQWWRPDGTLLTEAPNKKIDAATITWPRNRKALEAAIKVEGLTDNIGFTYGIDGALDSGSSGFGGQKIYVVSFDQARENDLTNIKIGIANRPWQTVMTHQSNFDGVRTYQDIIWHGPTEENEYAVINISHSFIDIDTRVVAIDFSGKEHIGKLINQVQKREGWKNVKAVFQLSLLKIKEFKFQIRPYEWATFKNVSLKPNFKTDVQIEVEKIGAAFKGDEVYGLRCLLQADKKIWKEDEIPILKAVIQNTGNKTFKIIPSQTMLSLDIKKDNQGNNYHSIERIQTIEGVIMPSQQLKPIEIVLNPNWASKGGKRLEMRPGKYTVTAAVKVYFENDPNESVGFEVFSNPVDIEVLPEEKPAESDSQLKRQEEVRNLFSDYIDGKKLPKGKTESLTSAPKLDWSDIPVLLKLGESTKLIEGESQTVIGGEKKTVRRSLPCSLVSSYMEKNCYEGMVALWLIEGIRQKQIGGHIPLNPICFRGDKSNFSFSQEWEKSPEIHQEVLRAYQNWWQKVAFIPANEAAEIDPLNSTDLQWFGSFSPKGATPLHYAASGGHKEMAEMLISKGLNINAADLDGNTPLHLAAENGHVELCGFLIEKGANVNAKNKAGLTPLDLAASKGHKATAELLISKGAISQEKSAGQGENSAPAYLRNIKFKVVDDVTGKPLSNRSVFIPGIPSPYINEEGEHILKLITDSNGVFVFDLSILKESPAFMIEFAPPYQYIFLKRYQDRRDIFSADHIRLETPKVVFPVRSYDLNKGIVKTITASGIEESKTYDFIELRAQNAHDSNGNTTLHLAAERGDANTCEFLIKLGANVNAKNKAGLTPLDLAASKGHKATAELLISKGEVLQETSAGQGEDSNIEKKKEFKAIMYNIGTTVELLGICEHPSVGKQWWLPDGSLLKESPYDDDFGKAFPEEGEKGYKFAIKFTGLADKDIDCAIIPTNNKSTNGGTLFSVSKKNGKENTQYVDGLINEKIVWFGAAFDEGLGMCDIRVGVCWGKWKEDYQYESNQPNPAVQWVTFKNVSLKPNYKTNVQIDGVNVAMGGFNFGKPYKFVFPPDTCKSLNIRGEPTFQFNWITEKIIAAIDIEYLSWPQTQWQVQLDIQDKQYKTLKSVKGIFKNSGTIETLPHVEKQQIQLDMGTPEEFKDVSHFDFSLESILSRQSNPILFYKDLPLSLQLSGSGGGANAQVNSVKFEKFEDRFVAVCHVKYTSNPKRNWKITAKILGDNNTVLAQGYKIFENIGIWKGLGVWVENDLKFSLKILNSEIKQKRYEITIETIPLRQEQDVQVEAILKTDSRIIDLDNKLAEYKQRLIKEDSNVNKDERVIVQIKELIRYTEEEKQRRKNQLEEQIQRANMQVEDF